MYTGVRTQLGTRRLLFSDELGIQQVSVQGPDELYILVYLSYDRGIRGYK